MQRSTASRSALSSASFACALALSLAASGCAKTFIPNTDVEDTSDNRRVVKFCEEYRHAVEEKNVGKLLSMVSPRYFEDGGNTNDEDDLDYEGFKQYLTSSFMKADGVRYEIRYRHVTFSNPNGSGSKEPVPAANKIYVDYTYSASWRIPGVKSEEWKHTVADNRLELEPDGESYKILSGM